MKKVFSIAVCLCLAAMLAACGTPAASPTVEAEAAVEATPTPAPNTFLGDEETRATFERAVDAYDYAEAGNILSAYIAENGDSEKENKALELCGQAEALLPNVYVRVDEFSETASASTLATEGSMGGLLVGKSFLAHFVTIMPEWLFFDKVTIKTGPGEFFEYSFGAGEKSEEVTSTGSALESATVDIKTDEQIVEFQTFLDADSPQLRYSGKRTYTEDVTPEDQQALTDLFSLFLINRDLYGYIAGS